MKVRNPIGIGKVYKQFPEIENVNVIKGGYNQEGVFMEIIFKDKTALIILPKELPFRVNELIKLIKCHLEKHK